MTPKYPINVFWSEADGAWVADVPDLRSCSAFGDSPTEALAEECSFVLGDGALDLEQELVARVLADRSMHEYHLATGCH